MLKYFFIGGTYRGFELLKFLMGKQKYPELAYILKEDLHEVMKYSASMAELLEKHHIPVFLRKKLTIEDYDYINKRVFDFSVCCGWRTMIDIKKIQNAIKLGVVAAHDSLLPKYRGFAPLNWAVINGEKETGVTLFIINNKAVDSGDIILQKKVRILENDYAIDVYQKITTTTIELYDKFFHEFQNGKIKLSKQNEKKATYTCKRTPQDGKINWEKTSQVNLNLIRGLAYPYPGAYCILDREVFRIRKAKLGINNQKVYAGRIPGRLIQITEAGVEVLCGKGSLFIEEWESEATKIVSCPTLSVNKISTTLI